MEIGQIKSLMEHQKKKENIEKRVKYICVWSLSKSMKMRLK